MSHLICIHKKYNTPVIRLKIIVGGDFNLDMVNFTNIANLSR